MYCGLNSLKIIQKISLTLKIYDIDKSFQNYQNTKNKTDKKCKALNWNKVGNKTINVANNIGIM